MLLSAASVNLHITKEGEAENQRQMAVGAEYGNGVFSLTHSFRGFASSAIRPLGGEAMCAENHTDLEASRTAA